MTRAMVLCAGLGTRLRPLTEQLPKPLVPIGDRPLFGHVVRYLAEAGFDSLVVNTHWLPEAFTPVLAALPLAAVAVHEPVIRGTAGGVAGARHLFGTPPILVYNGDVLVAPPVTALFSRVGDGLCLAVAPRARGCGTVGRDAEGRVVRLRGEVFGAEVAGGDYVGVAALGVRCLAGLPDLGCLIGDVALPLLRAGGRVETVDAAGDFVDAGTPADYLQANLDWLSASGHDHWLGEGASVAPGVAVQRTVVGRGARVEGNGELREVVVWPGAVARAPLARAVVTSRGVLAVP